MQSANQRASRPAAIDITMAVTRHRRSAKDPPFWKALWVCLAAILGSSCAKPGTEKSQERIRWAGHELQEVTTLHQLPPPVQMLLGVGTPGLEGIADRNGAYNPTDVADSNLPMRRFLIAGLDADSALVAIERGGLGWSVEVALFSNTNKNPTVERKWTLFESPKTLGELVDRLPLR